MLFFDEGRYGEFLDLAIAAQEERYDASNLFRRSGIYYRSQEMDIAEGTACLPSSGPSWPMSRSANPGADHVSSMCE